MRHFIVCGSLLLAACLVAAQGKPVAKQASLEPIEGVSGRQTYQQYCASCHGENAKGGGPAAAALKTPPPDLTTLAKQNGGKFPYEYVGGVVRFGKPISAHGSSDMPVWGPIFNFVDYNEIAIRKRIKNLCDYLASLQQK
jgi:mono/diheme cytochrome c family protein